MKFIEFDKEKCDNCFKCLRICPVKAISFNMDQREILEDLCIKCGLCQSQCEHHALTICNPIDQVKSYTKDAGMTAVSIAPSFVGSFKLAEPGKMVKALKALGFDLIEETAIGAEIVSLEFEKHIQGSEQENLITSCCPSVNYLVEKHYPKLLDYMLPVVSPMIAHGRSLKNRYGKACRVVFIGPCLAKMAEAEEQKGAIDSVITFEELNQWLIEEKLVLEQMVPDSFNIQSSNRGKAFPLGAELELSKKQKGPKKLRRINGASDCKALLEELENKTLKGYCFEMNICEGSCNNGPDIPGNKNNRFEREQYMVDYVEKKKSNQSIGLPLEHGIDMKRLFNGEQCIKAKHSNDSIKKVLRQMGKYSYQDEMNCGACGYSTCRDKAEAVCNGYSDINNCLMYLRGKAENMHSVLIDNSPNAVCTISHRLEIIKYNPSFDRIFNREAINLKEVPIGVFMDEDLFAKALNEKINIKDVKVYNELLHKYFILNIIYHEKEDILLIFFTDISQNEEKKSELEKVKKETLLKTQEVIDNQMRVAQEIASLLGETTAETKMSLNSLKDLVLKNDEVS